MSHGRELADGCRGPLAVAEGGALSGNYDMKLLDIDMEHLTIPETDYDADVSLPATEFQRIIHNLRDFDENVTINIEKGNIRFAADGDDGEAVITLTETTADQAADEDESADEQEDDEQEDEKPKTKKVVSQPVPSRSRMCTAELSFFALPQDNKKRKPFSSGDGKKPVKKPKKDKSPTKVSINVQKPVKHLFGAKHLVNLAKSTPLSAYVNLHMSEDVPLLVEYPFDAGHIKFHLSPRVRGE